MNNNINKAKLIMPVIVLSAAAISVITMFLRHYDFYQMLWCLLAVLIIFYIIGDAVQYMYLRIKPRVIPEADDIEKLLSKVDTSKLQLDESLLQQYLDAGNDEGEEIPDEILQQAKEFDIGDDFDFNLDSQDENEDNMFMDETLDS